MWGFRKIQAKEEPVFNNTSEKYYNLGMDIIEETGLSSVLKARINDRPYLGKDARYGRRVFFEMNKAYPVVMRPMLDKDTLKGYFWSICPIIMMTPAR